MQTTPLTFRIGVPTYQRPEDLACFLQAIAPQLQGRSNVRLVVVNDASHSPNYAAIADQYRDIMEYRVLKENGGPALARNEAFRGATEDYLVHTDDDCYPEAHWLDWLEALARSYPQVDLFAGEILPVWTNEPSLYDRLLAIPDAYPAPAFTKYGLLTAVTANAMVKREFFEKVGGFSHNLRGASEDYSLTQRLLNAGACYQVAAGWRVGHKARTRIGEMRRRFRGYGKGGAQASLLENDWKLAAVSSRASVKQSLQIVQRKSLRYWNDSSVNSSFFLWRAVQTALSALIATEYELGWRKGVKQFGREYGRVLPERPGVSERFVDFSDPRQLQTAMDGKGVSSG